MTDVDVACAAAGDGDGWSCHVRVRGDWDSTEHQVTVRSTDAVAHGVGTVDDAERIVRETFAFLLEHEPKESILFRFDLGVVERYFPGYQQEIRARLSR